MTTWSDKYLQGQAYTLGSYGDGLSAASLNTPAAGIMFITPFWIPSNVTIGTTKLGVYNSNTTADNLTIRVGIYQVSDPEEFLLDTLIVDGGTFTKNTTAVTTIRYTSTFTEVFLGPSKLYCAVARVEVAAVGNNGFLGALHPLIKPGAVGDDSATDHWLGTGQQASVSAANAMILDTGETGALDADYSALGPPTVGDTSIRAPAVYIYINSIA